MNATTTALSFHDHHFDVIDRSGQPWLRAFQVGRALGYTDEKSIHHIYSRHADEFTDNMAGMVKLTTPSGEQEVRIFSLRGCHLLAMFARTKVAKEFRRWVLDVLDSLAEPPAKLYSIPRTKKALPGGLTLEQQDAVKALVKSRVDVLPKERQGGAAITCWSSIKSKFKASYKEVSPEHFGEVLSLVARLPLTGEHIPADRVEPPPAHTDDQDYRAAREQIEYLRGFARNLPPHASRPFLESLDELSRCVIRGWTEIDEAMLRLTTAMALLRRWKGKH
jgi:prophage antirepressor-like protein